MDDGASTISSLGHLLDKVNTAVISDTEGEDTAEVFITCPFGKLDNLSGV